MKLNSITSDFISAKEIENLSPTSLRLYAYVMREIEAFYGDVDIDQITSASLREFMAFERERKGRHGLLKSQTLQRYHVIIGIFLRWARQQGYIEDNPIRRVAKPRSQEMLPEALSAEELQKVFDYIARNRPFAIQVIFEFLLDTGCRVSEVAKLNVEDVDLDQNWVKITGKGSREAIVPIGDRMSTQLYRYINDIRPETDSNALFITRNGSRYSSGSIAQIVRRVLVAVGVEGKCGPHKLRHTFATNYLRNGGNLESLRRILRHKNIATTQRYLSLTNEDLRDEHKRFSPLDSLFKPKPPTP